ncbi:hypothetical protein OH77DRAFT_1484952 [Trametes cingulata]|nr:hypothetical protein OH77DRAFT_1484952 [Trametes cingulata]
MPCNWSTRASSILQSVRVKSLFARPTGRPSHSQLTARTGHCAGLGGGLLPHPQGFRGLATAAAAPVQPDQDPQAVNSIASSIRATTAQLSAAQVSRAAAQAVRLSVRDGNYGDALYVVNSACHSVLQGPLDSAAERPHLQPIDFGCAVSPRLAAHAFLHGLIRGGYTRKAATYAKLMIRCGIPIRTRTLESAISSLVSPPSALPQIGPFARVLPLKPSVDNPTVLQLRKRRVADPSTRAALELLQVARSFGQRRTERMHRVLIETLIMQGEILVASLLFVLLIKDFEVRGRNAVSNEDQAGDNDITYEVLRVPLPSRAATTDVPFPDPRIMQKILAAIDSTRDPGTGVAASQSLQSLAIFAMLLDTGQIGHHRVAGLISSLYDFPKTRAHVWIIRDRRAIRVPAYEYIHGVLKRLIDSLSQEDSSRPAPFLSRRSYNALLNYALRHRLSPKMASAVLQHMCVVRDPPISPDVVTYNILLRSGTLLRQLSISQEAVAALRLDRAGHKHRHLLKRLPPVEQPVAAVPVEATRLRPDAVAGTPELPVQSLEGYPYDEDSARDSHDKAGFAVALRRLTEEATSFPVPSRASPHKLKRDRYTLSSRVSHLTAIGRPDVIATHLFRMLPELVIVDHPATGTLHPDRLPSIDRVKAMKMAVARGPYIYATFINALAKAGEVGLAERVLVLAQHASRASYIPDFAPGVAPWRLTVHAYTAMMQGYARVAHEKVPRHKLHHRYTGTTVLERRIDWRPRSRLRRVSHGYAQFVHMLHEHEKQRRVLTKPQRTRRNALLLYRSMMSGGRSLFDDLIHNSKVRPLRTPYQGLPQSGYQVKPDARFFNAALKLFGPRLERMSKRRCDPAYWHRRLRVSMRGYERSKASSQQWSPMLDKILKAMVATGFEVPLAYRHLLVGKWDPVAFRPASPRRRLLQRPYVYPPTPKGAFRAQGAPVFKTRGLPVLRTTLRRRRWRRSRRKLQGGGDTRTVS